MKTRVIHTRIWRDNYFSSLGRGEKLLFLYTLFNESNNMSGIYEFNDQEAMLRTGLTSRELEKAKSKFTKDKKLIFLRGWVKVVNHAKYNRYGRGEKQGIALQRELALLPPFMKKIDTSIDTSIDTVSILALNPKPKKRIDKTEIETEINHKEEISKIATKFSLPISTVQDTYERVRDYELSRGKRYRNRYAAVRNWIRKDLSEGRLSRQKKRVRLAPNEFVGVSGAVYRRTKDGAVKVREGGRR